MYNDDNKSELEKLAKTINDSPAFQLKVASDNFNAQVGMIMIIGFFLFIFGIIFCPSLMSLIFNDSSPNKTSITSQLQPSQYHEITLNEFRYFWDMFCRTHLNDAPDNAGQRWSTGKWIDVYDKVKGTHFVSF